MIKTSDIAHSLELRLTELEREIEGAEKHLTDLRAEHQKLKRSHAALTDSSPKKNSKPGEVKIAREATPPSTLSDRIVWLLENGPDEGMFSHDLFKALSQISGDTVESSMRTILSQKKKRGEIERIARKWRVVGSQN